MGHILSWSGISWEVEPGDTLSSRDGAGQADDVTPRSSGETGLPRTAGGRVLAGCPGTTSPRGRNVGLACRVGVATVVRVVDARSCSGSRKQGGGLGDALLAAGVVRQQLMINCVHRCASSCPWSDSVVGSAGSDGVQLAEGVGVARWQTWRCALSRRRRSLHG